MRRPKCDIKRTREEYGRMEQNNIEKDFFTPHTHTHRPYKCLANPNSKNQNAHNELWTINVCLLCRLLSH